MIDRRASSEPRPSAARASPSVRRLVHPLDGTPDYRIEAMRLSTGERKVLTPGVKSYVTPMGHLCWGVGFGGRGAGHLHPGGRRDYLAGCVGRRAAAGCTVNTNPRGWGRQRPQCFRGLAARRKTHGRLAQLVQSAWFTPRRSLVRIQYRPLPEGQESSDFWGRQPPPALHLLSPLHPVCIPPEDCRGEVRFGSGQPWWQAAGQAVGNRPQ